MADGMGGVIKSFSAARQGSSMIPTNWPFKPDRLPFFYGWVVFICSTLGVIFSLPGQTIGLAVFTDSLIDVLGLSRTELSMAYLLGTIVSSLFLARAGRWYDIWGGRIMIPAASVGLSLMIFFVSSVDRISASISASLWGSFCIILIGYAGVRFFGQGVLVGCSRNLLLPWFVRKRGLVIGLRGVAATLAFSVAPLLLATMISVYGWREALWILALTGGIGFSLVAIILIRDNPSSCGLRADGISADSFVDLPVEVVSQTRKEAQNSAVFWVYSLSLCMHALIGTALVFHIVSVFDEAGRGSVEAFNYFIPIAIVATTTNLLASWYSDRVSLKPFLIALLVAMSVGCYGFIYLESDWSYWPRTIGMGVATGLWGVLSNLAFIRFFGSRHLGEISGLNASVNVFFSAIGPAAFSLGFDYFGHYGAALKICLLALAILLVIAIVLPQDESQPAP